MRGAQDATPQRRLVYELAAAIDLVQQKDVVGGGHAADARIALDRLLDANPRSSLSTHVLHNIGTRRARWLRSYAAARGRAAASST